MNFIGLTPRWKRWINHFCIIIWDCAFSDNEYILIKGRRLTVFSENCELEKAFSYLTIQVLGKILSIFKCSQRVLVYKTIQCNFYFGMINIRTFKTFLLSKSVTAQKFDPLFGLFWDWKVFRSILLTYLILLLLGKIGKTKDNKEKF